MEGAQKEVYEAMMDIADKILHGFYGEGDEFGFDDVLGEVEEIGERMEE